MHEQLNFPVHNQLYKKMRLSLSSNDVGSYAWVFTLSRNVFFFLEQRLWLPLHCDLAWYILHNWRYYGRLLKFITQRARHASGEKKKCIFRWYSSNLCWLNGSVLHFCFPFLLSELIAPFTRSVPFQYSCTIHLVLFVLHASRSRFPHSSLLI